MARAHRVRSAQLPYHITSRCLNKDWFQLPIDQVWEVFSEQLFFCSHAYKLDIHAFVLMSNHYHMMLTTPEANICEFMRTLNTETSRELNRSSGRINQTYGGPYYSSLITTDIYYMHAYKYLYRNPVESGLSKNVESYRFSTLNSLLGFSKGIIPLAADETLFPNVQKTLSWMNTDYKDGAKELIRNALKKKTFKFSRCPSTRKKIWLEEEIS